MGNCDILAQRLKTLRADMSMTQKETDTDRLSE